jgi:predicted Zn-dependent peptidase
VPRSSDAAGLVHEHTYPNGLVLAAEPMPGVQSAAFTLLLPAGAAYDPQGRGGCASMLSEWITRGAGDRDAFALLSALDALGVNHGESAQTAHTSIGGATLGRNLIPALEIFADVVRRPRLDESEVEPIRALALQGLRSLEDDPPTKVIYDLRARHFPDPWGRASPGSMEGVTAMTPDDLREFHAGNYRPNGAYIGVAGAVDWPALQDAVGRLFGDWPARPEPAVLERATGPSRDHVSSETNQIQVAMAFPTAPLTHLDYYRARAAAAILGGYSSARLFTEVREKRGLCYSVYAAYETHRDRAAVICYAGTAAERAQETLDVAVAEIERLKQSGVEVEELDTMRAGLKSALVMAQESSLSRSSSLASDFYHLGRVRSLREITGALDALTADSVGAYAAAWDLDALTILTLGPKELRFPR